jgi:hypothetical protein
MYKANKTFKKTKSVYNDLLLIAAVKTKNATKKKPEVQILQKDTFKKETMLKRCHLPIIDPRESPRS